MSTTGQNIDAAVIEAVADAMYPYWLANGGDVKAALMSVHQDHPSKRLREQAWASHQFAIDFPMGLEAHKLAMEKRRDAERQSAG